MARVYDSDPNLQELNSKDRLFEKVDRHPVIGPTLWLRALNHIGVAVAGVNHTAGLTGRETEHALAALTGDSRLQRFDEIPSFDDFHGS
jgi:hypothetical protein